MENERMGYEKTLLDRLERTVKEIVKEVPGGFEYNISMVNPGMLMMIQTNLRILYAKDIYSILRIIKDNGYGLISMQTLKGIYECGITFEVIRR